MFGGWEFRAKVFLRVQELGLGVPGFTRASSVRGFLGVEDLGLRLDLALSPESLVGHFKAFTIRSPSARMP